MARFTKLVSWLGLLVGSALLVLQFFITITARLQNGDTLLGALWFLLTFFTILTNAGVVLVYVFDKQHIIGWQWLRKASTRTMFAVAIFVVMAVYHFVLAPLWQPQGLFAVADIGLHYVTPIIYLTWWATYVRSEQTRFSHIPVMLLPPIVYLVWAMLRGLLIGKYPYPFLDLNAIGPLQTGINVVALFAGLAALYAVFIAIEQRLPRRTRVVRTNTWQE